MNVSSKSSSAALRVVLPALSTADCAGPVLPLLAWGVRLYQHAHSEPALP